MLRVFPASGIGRDCSIIRSHLQPSSAHQASVQGRGFRHSDSFATRTRVRRGVRSARTRSGTAIRAEAQESSEIVYASSDSSSSKMTRRAWRYAGTKAGKISELKLLEDDLPLVHCGDIKVKVKAVGLNFADVFTCLGLYNAFPGIGIPGLEFSGVIEEIADSEGGLPVREDQSEEVLAAAQNGARKLKVGDRVMGVTRFGAFADEVVLPAHQVLPLPEGWTFAQGASFLVQGLTAIYGLSSLGGIRKGHRVLVHSAAGGVGMFAMAICEAIGAIPIATVGSSAKVDFLLGRFKSLTPETVIIRDPDNFKQQLSNALSATGGSAVDIVLDAVAGRFFEPGYSMLERGGRYVVFGAADMTPSGDGVGWLKLAWQWLTRPRLDPLKMTGENRAVMGFNLIWMFDKAEMLMELAHELEALGIPPPFVGEQFAFEDAREAIRKLQSGTTKGKVVLIVDEK